MKALTLLLILSSFLPAKTWIELAKEADYHSEHPGRKIEIPEDHPNGLGEFMRDGMISAGIAETVHTLIRRNLIQEISWGWLNLEAVGTDIAAPEQLIKLLPLRIREDIKTFTIEIDVAQRTITAPKESLMGVEHEPNTTVPKLFPN